MNAKAGWALKELRVIAGWYLICSSQKSNSGNFFKEAAKVCQEATVEWVSVLPCFPLSALGHSAYLFLTIPPFHLPQVFTSSVIETDHAKSWIESKNPVSFQSLSFYLQTESFQTGKSGEYGSGVCWSSDTAWKQSSRDWGFEVSSQNCLWSSLSPWYVGKAGHEPEAMENSRFTDSGGVRVHDCSIQQL